MFIVVIFKYFVACTGKVSPLRIIGGGLLEEGRVSVSGPHGEQFIFSVGIMSFYHLSLPLLGSF